MTDAEKDRWLSWDRERSELQANQDKDDEKTTELIHEGFQFLKDRGEQSKKQQEQYVILFSNRAYFDGSLSLANF